MGIAVHDAVFDRQEALGIFGRHTEERGDDHPENGPRASGTDRCGDSDDISGADGGG